MNAELYLKAHKSMANYSIIKEILADLKPLRGDLKATREYIAQNLEADVRYNERQDESMQGLDVGEFVYNGKIGHKIMCNLRYDLLDVLRDDLSYSFAYFAIAKNNKEELLLNVRQRSLKPYLVTLLVALEKGGNIEGTDWKQFTNISKDEIDAIFEVAGDKADYIRENLINAEKRANATTIEEYLQPGTQTKQDRKKETLNIKPAFDNSRLETYFAKEFKGIGSEINKLAWFTKDLQGCINRCYRDIAYIALLAYKGGYLINKPHAFTKWLQIVCEYMGIEYKPRAVSYIKKSASANELDTMFRYLKK
jgi:hypothetical protein